MTERGNACVEHVSAMCQYYADRLVDGESPGHHGAELQAPAFSATRGWNDAPGPTRDSETFGSILRDCHRPLRRALIQSNRGGTMEPTNGLTNYRAKGIDDPIMKDIVGAYNPISAESVRLCSASLLSYK